MKESVMFCPTCNCRSYFSVYSNDTAECSNCGYTKAKKAFNARNFILLPAKFDVDYVCCYGADYSKESFKRISNKYLEENKDEYGFCRVVKMYLNREESELLTYAYNGFDWYVLSIEKLELRY
jgi:hypothetical protein